MNEIEYSEYTFKPEISSKSKTMIKDSSKTDVFERLQINAKKKKAMPEENLDFKPKINQKSREMATKKKEREREENIVKNLEAISSGVPQNKVKIADQVAKNNATDMERQFQNIYDKAYQNITMQIEECDDGDEEYAPKPRTMPMAEEFANGRYTIDEVDTYTKFTSETQPNLRKDMTPDDRAIDKLNQ